MTGIIYHRSISIIKYHRKVMGVWKIIIRSKKKSIYAIWNGRDWNIIELAYLTKVEQNLSFLVLIVLNVLVWRHHQLQENKQTKKSEQKPSIIGTPLLLPSIFSFALFSCLLYSALFLPPWKKQSLRAWTWANLPQQSRLQNPKLCCHICRVLCPSSLSLCPTSNCL